MEMESSTVHRRIELQSPEDFTYLIDNVRRAAADSINAAFPPVDGAKGDEEEEEEDELRVRIEQLVNDYITKTFTLVAPNISINGLPVSDPSEFLSISSPLNSPSMHTMHTTTNGTSCKPAGNKKSKSKVTKSKKNAKKPQEEYEAFDPRKRARLEQLAREEEDLLRSIALLKRRVPSSAAASFSESFAKQSEADRQALEKAKQRVVEEGVLAGRKVLEGFLSSPLAGVAGGAGGEREEAGGEGHKDGDGEGRQGGGGNNNSRMERQKEIEDEFGKAVEALRRLKSQMPATVARMEKARVAGGYVVAGTGGDSFGEER